MADIFLSYAKEDREIARKIGKRLESIGWSVWWDREIPAGKNWRATLEEALTDMRCMVVLWSRHSIRSDWVKEEAEEGRSQGKLVPIFIESVRPPVGFRAIQAADLIDWDGSKNFPGFIQLTSALQSMLGKRVETASMIERRRVRETNRHDEHERGFQFSGSEIMRFGKQMPSSSYAVVTLVVTLLGAALIRNQDIAPGPPAPASLPVKSSDAKESGTPTPLTVPRPSAAPMKPNRPESSVTKTRKPYSPAAATDIKHKKSAETAARSENPVRAQDQNDDSPCGEILTRAQLGEPIPDSDREFLGKECSDE